jgi:hypothetical protein
LDLRQLGEVEELEKYDPERDLHQLGDGWDITSIPFTASPLGLAKKIAKDISPKTLSAWSDLRVGTWKETMVSHSPPLDVTLECSAAFEMMNDTG